jgi:hypothetical protein
MTSIIVNPTLTAALHEDLARRGADALGAPLTSRPKRLIHVTCGRLLAWPLLAPPPPPASSADAPGATGPVASLFPASRELSDAARARGSRVVARWARALARGELPSGRAGEAGAEEVPQPLPNLGARVALRDIALVRDTQWMMGQRHTYRTYARRRTTRA